jgi:non-heme chloroperoxidase
VPYLKADDGSPLYYTDDGRGPTIFLLHGLTMNHKCFRHNRGPLAGSHRVVTMDMRAHGSSAKLAQNWTLDQASRDVRTVIDTLGLNDVTLVGWSMGTTVIHNYVENFGGERLRAAAFIDMTPNPVREPDWEHCVFGVLDRKGALEVLRDLFQDRSAVQSAFVSACFKDGQVPDDETAEWWLAETMLTPSEALAAFWVSAVTQDWRAQLPTFPVPVLLCYGAHSATYPTDLGLYLEKEIPTSRLVIFDNSGHSPCWEEPDRFNSELAQFVADVTSASTR